MSPITDKEGHWEPAPWYVGLALTVSAVASAVVVGALGGLAGAVGWWVFLGLTRTTR